MRRLAMAMGGGIVLAVVAVATHPTPAQGAPRLADPAVRQAPIMAPLSKTFEAGVAIPE
ncbi:hypothetical protein [Sphingomonas pseudosanguinis]|uniref:Uncharacterized protein n=1 Tax=Sphingomonas pseudosanguinis TaxID=413712 RepID=A0A7W6F2R5_9SPHN|nr:hypothetical protein [Sphingomonas pseudosanguinis]MBB3879196.1 hypothetical protein [Sphingomonas pseudosanguinis]MBN3535231.1 hypothetical protein [Sphingomonas pseudosanguinis]